MTFSVRAAARILALGALFLSPCASASANSYTYQGGSGGTTSAPKDGSFSGNNFNPSLGTTSTSSSTYADMLVFGGVSYTATDDIAQAIQVNALSFSNSGAVMLAAGTGNNSISLGGTAPSVNLSGSGTVNIGLNLAMAADTTFNGPSGSSTAITVGGVISGSFNLTANANLVFSGANTYTGTTTISSSKSIQVGSLGSAGRLGSGDVIDNGLLNLYSSGQIVSNNISGSGGIGLLSTGSTVTLSGSNSFTGVVTTNANTLKLGSTAALGSSSSITVSVGGALDFNGYSPASSSSLTLVMVNDTSGGVRADTVGTLANSGVPITFAGKINGTGTAGFIVSGSGNTTLSGAINLTGASSVLAMNGTGTLTVSGSADNGTLGLTVSTGNVVLGKSSGTNVHAVSSNGLTISGGTVQLAGSGEDQIADNAALDVEGGTFDLNGHSETVGNFLSLASNGIVTNTATGTPSTLMIGGQNTGNGGTFSGTISSGAGTLSLVKTGTGSIKLSGANTYTGGTTVNNGRLTAISNTALGTGGLTFTPTSGNSATVTFTSASPSVASLSSSDAGTSAIVLGAANTTTVLTFGSDNTNQTFGGTISDSSATAAIGKLVKTGKGTQTLSGANTYTGGTAVNSGTLSGNTGSYGSGAVTVAQNATVNYTQSGGSTGTATNNISGQGTASFGGVNGSGGTVNYTGQDSASQTNVQSGTVILSRTGGSAITGPVAIATGGTLKLGASTQIATAAQGTTASTNVALSGGTFNANGYSDGSISGSDPTTAAVTSHMGTLTLAGGMSTLDFGTTQAGSGPFVLAFADSSAIGWSGTLNVIDYVGGKDALYVGNSASLSPTQLAQIRFGSVGATQFSNGAIAPAPEPDARLSLLVGAASLAALAGVRRLRT